MDKTLIIKKIKNKFISKKEKYKQFYKEAYSTYSFLKDIADTRYLKPVKGQLRNYQLMILDFGKLWFDKFEELNISYFLISGNLLGAYRNGGFIPWDDDLDIGMMRTDFNKLIDYLKKNYKEMEVNEIYYSKNNRNKVVEDYIRENPNITSFAIFPTHLQILQGDNMKNLKTLDIHPYDYYKENFSKKDLMEDIKLIKQKKSEIDNFEKLNQYLKEKRLNNPLIANKSDKIYYGIDNYDYTFIEFSDWYKYEDIFPLHKVKFENIECYIPNNTEKVLTINYGKNYMSMPKEIILNSHIEYRTNYLINKMSKEKQLLVKKLKRKFQTKEEDIYKDLYKKIKPCRDLLLDIVDIKTIKPCQDKFLRKSQLDCVDFCKTMCDFFDSHNLEYFITSGTLIGAVRHKGFVPWDDDFDVGMMRKDYEKLKTILRKNYKEIDCSNMSLSEHNQNDIINEALKKSNNEIIFFIGPKYIQIYRGTILSDSVVIDIFPHEYYRDDYTLKEHKIHMSKIINKINELDKYPLIIDYLNNEIKENSNVVEKSQFIYYGFDSLGSYIVNPTGSMSQDMIFPRQKIVFEGYEFFAPNNPDGYIKVQYPNYMEFPSNFKIAPFLKIKAKYKL